MKWPIKRPKLQFYGTLPCLAALVHDILFSVTHGRPFEFSRISWFISHDYRLKFIEAIDNPYWIAGLTLFYNVKLVFLTAALAGIVFVILNRPRRSDYGPVRGTRRRSRRR